MNCLSNLGAAALALTIACTATAAPPPATTTVSSYTLAGPITGLGNEWIYLKHVSTNKIDSIKASAHYVLIDFWASWCGPCREENPAVVKAYKTYHSKGFDILSVSLDDNKAKWLEAIKKDHLSWTHVSDLQGWQNSVAIQYGIAGVPMNFLVDKEGRIVAKGLRGEDLEKKLAEVLH